MKVDLRIFAGVMCFGGVLTLVHTMLPAPGFGLQRSVSPTISRALQPLAPNPQGTLLALPATAHPRRIKEPHHRRKRPHQHRHHVHGAATSGPQTPRLKLRHHRSSRALDSTQSPVSTQRLDLQHASLEQLESLPQIDHQLAERILALREAGGGFDRFDDLLDVQGMTPAKIAQLRPFFLGL